MHVAIQHDRPGLRLEAGLGAEVLFEGVQLADVEPAARSQDAPRLAEDMSQVRDVLQDEAAAHPVKTPVRKWPFRSEVQLLEFDMGGGDLGLGLGEHAGAEIGRNQALAARGKPDGVFASAAAEFEDVGGRQVGEQIAEGLAFEVAGGVAVVVVCGGPSVVAGDVGIGHALN